MTPGERIREARKEKGMTQGNLAEAMHFSRTYIALIETGRRPIPAEALEGFAEALGVPVAQLTEDGRSDA